MYLGVEFLGRGGLTKELPACFPQRRWRFPFPPATREDSDLSFIIATALLGGRPSLVMVLICISLMMLSIFSWRMCLLNSDLCFQTEARTTFFFLFFF